MEPMKLDYKEIQQKLRNRYPLLFLDEVGEIEPGKYAKGFKYLTLNEWFFEAHFPGNPIMPGCLLTEAMSQMGAIALTTLPECEGKVVKMSKLHDVSFFREVVPGKRLDLEAEIVSWRRGIARIKTKALVDDEIVSAAEMTLLVDGLVPSVAPRHVGSVD